MNNSAQLDTVVPWKRIEYFATIQYAWKIKAVLGLP